MTTSTLSIPPVADRWPALRERLAPWLLPVALLAAWELAARLGWLSSRILPEPFAVGRAAWELAASGELWTHLSKSLLRAASGFAVGGGLGLALGLLTGTFRSDACYRALHEDV